MSDVFKVMQGSHSIRLMALTIQRQRTDNSWLQVDQDGSRDVFSRSSFAEESVERVVPAPKGGAVAGHLAIRHDAMLETIQLPASVPDLHSSLANMNGDTLTL